MTDDKKMAENRKLLSVLCAMVSHNQSTAYKISLSNGQVIEGELSPFDDQSDYIRVNSEDHTGTTYIPMAHIVYVQKKAHKAPGPQK